MRGWGAAWNGKGPVSGYFDARNEGSSINELELLAAIHGRAFAQFACSRQVTLVSDSLVTVHIVRNWTSRGAAPPIPLADATRVMRKNGRYPYLPGTCPQCSIYGPIVYSADERVLHGDSPKVLSPLDAALPRAARRWRWLTAPSRERLWPAGSRVSPSCAVAGVALPSFWRRLWVSYRPGVARPSLVPIGGSLRSRCPFRAYRHSPMSVDHNRLQPTTSAAT
jgi:hypothetical protein